MSVLGVLFTTVGFFVLLFIIFMIIFIIGITLQGKITGGMTKSEAIYELLSEIGQLLWRRK